MIRLTAAVFLLFTLGACGRNGAVRVVVRFENFEPGCLEVSAADAAGGEAEVLELDAEKLSGGKALVGVGQKKEWSRELKLQVRSFEKGCDGPVLEEHARTVTVAGDVVEWEVELTAADADGDTYAGATASVKGTDCDETSTARHPGAAETCGTLDMNCDGLVGCADPLCVGQTCDDGVASNILDVCVAGGGCAGRGFTDCAPGTFISQAGTTTTDRVCSPCATGSFSSTPNAASCSTWADCAPGLRVDSMPTSSNDRTCVACSPGTFSALPNSNVCAPITGCAAGFVEMAPTQCVACSPGTYCAGGVSPAVPCATGTYDHDTNPASTCLAWMLCAPGSAVSAPGTTTTNPSCPPCAAGNFCAGQLAPAVPCAAGSWDDDANSATACVAWATCAAGTTINAPGSATTNRTCAACAAGTFSNSANAVACTPWTACVPGQVRSTAGTATADQLCAACPSGFFTNTPNATSCTAWSAACNGDTYETAAPTASADRACANFVSCLDRLTRVPASATGFYVIDPDGPGPIPPYPTVYCDMTTAGGGWTVVSAEDFTATSAGWSDTRRDTSSSCFDDWGITLGGPNLFGNNASVSKTYNLFAVPHTNVRVVLTYLVIDSWDNERAQVSIDGTLIYNQAFSSVGAPNTCGAIHGDRGPQPVAGSIPHTSNNPITLNVTSTLDQGAGDESFAVDNIFVMVR